MLERNIRSECSSLTVEEKQALIGEKITSFSVKPFFCMKQTLKTFQKSFWVVEKHIQFSFQNQNPQKLSHEVRVTNNNNTP